MGVDGQAQEFLLETWGSAGSSHSGPQIGTTHVFGNSPLNTKIHRTCIPMEKTLVLMGTTAGYCAGACRCFRGTSLASWPKSRPLHDMT